MINPTCGVTWTWRRHPVAAAAAGAAFAIVAVTISAGLARAQTLQEFSPVRDTTVGDQVTVFIDGNARNVVGQRTSTPTTGTIGITYRGSTYIVSGAVAALSRRDTLTGRLASTLLAPAAGQAFNSAIIDARRAHLPWIGRGCSSDAVGRRCQYGLHAYVSASTSTWATQTGPDGAVTGTAEVPVWGSGAGPYFRFFDGRVGDSARVAMVLDVGVATRHLRGDLSSARPEMRALRESLLRTNRRNFAGLETTLTVRYNEITGALSYYRFGGDVPGLSGGQVVAGISLRARLNAGRFTAL